MRVEHIGNATLYLGDCLQLLQDLPAASIDALVTDPPYAAAAATVVTGLAKETWGRNWGDMSLVLMLAREVFGAKCLKTEHCAYWFCDHLAHAAVLPWLFGRYPLVQTLIWDKDMLGVGGSYRKQTELVLYARTADGPKVGTSMRDIIRLRPKYATKQHPAEKPLELIEQIVNASMWETCLDPFMGSGTTGVACIKAGRKFVGIEIEERHFNIACERIDAATRQHDIFGSTALRERNDA